MNTPTAQTSPASYVPHAAISVRAAVSSLLVGMALVVPVSILVSALPLPHPDADMLRVSAARLAPLHTHPWLLALHALVVAPLWEEFVYRGLILQFLRKYLPLWAAVAVPTLLFAGMHFTFSYQNAALAVVVGLAFAWLAVRSRSVYPAMLCHAGVNLCSLFAVRPVVSALGWKSSHDVSGLLVAVACTGSLLALVWGVRVLRAEFRSPARRLAVAQPVAFAGA